MAKLTPAILAMKIRTTVHRRMILMTRPLDEPIPERAPTGSFTFAEMTPDILEAYLALGPARQSHIDGRLATGSRCFLALDDGAIAHIHWMTTRRVRVDYLEADLVPPPRTVYIYDSYTPPQYRGRGLA